MVAYQERRNEPPAGFVQRGCFIDHPAAHRPALRRRRQRFSGVPAQRAGGDSLPSGAGPVFQGIFAWIGFPTYRMPYQVEEQANGASKWSLGKLFGYAMEGITAFSTKLLLP